MRLLRWIVVAAVIAPGCQQERPDADYISPGGEGTDVAVRRIQPGPAAPSKDIFQPRLMSVENPLEGDAWDRADGLRLYRWMNCIGCHGEGGGSIGPALWNDQWIYGGRDVDLFASIYYGRPDGMPSFGGKIPDTEIWKLVAYIKSLRPGGGMINAGEK